MLGTLFSGIVLFKLPNNEIFQLPLKKVTTGGRKFWIGTLNIDEEKNRNYSIVKSNLTEKISVYDDKGILIMESEIGELIALNSNINIQFVEFITSTGLQIKSDPGISIVYLSFLLLMTSIYISFFTYSQIWSFDTLKETFVGGQSNRAVLAFQEELRKIFKRTIKTIS